MTGKTWQERTKSKNCRICGGKAASFNFNGLSCESCKTFFRRNAFKPPNAFPCLSRADCCILSSKNRKKCKRCRLNRCLDIGMNRQLIWRKGYQLAKINLPKFVIEKYTKLQAVRPHQLLMTPFQEVILELIEEASKQFVEENSLPIVGHAQNLLQALTLPQNYIVLFIKYCKSLPDFKCLHKMDQLTLLKSSYVAILNIRFAFAHNLEQNQYPVMADQAGSNAILVDNRVLYDWNKRDMPIRFIKFQQTLNIEMENDPTIRNLLQVQMLFKPDADVCYKSEAFLRYRYFIYCHILLKYLEKKYQCYLKARKKYISLTHALAAIQYQIDIHREIFSELHLGDVDQVHKEIFDLD